MYCIIHSEDEILWIIDRVQKTPALDTEGLLVLTIMILIKRPGGSQSIPLERALVERLPVRLRVHYLQKALGLECYKSGIARQYLDSHLC